MGNKSQGDAGGKTQNEALSAFPLKGRGPSMDNPALERPGGWGL